MELHIKDRIYIPQILPKDGTFAEFNIKREILKKVSLTEKDRVDYNIQEVPEEGKITWDSQKDMKEALHVDFSQQEIEYMKKACESVVDTSYPDDFWITVEKIYNEIG